MTTKKNLDEAVRRLVDLYDPLSIYLFEEKPDSIFVIVVEGSWLKPLKRGLAGKYALWELEGPKDILVFTKDEFDERLQDSYSLAYQIKKDGKMLYFH